MRAKERLASAIETNKWTDKIGCSYTTIIAELASKFAQCSLTNSKSSVGPRESNRQLVTTLRSGSTADQPQALIGGDREDYERVACI